MSELLLYYVLAFEAHGFYTGSFSLDYPIKTTLEFPEDFSFNYGGPATIHTSYEVTDGWALETSFPPVGVITLDFEYQFDPFMNDCSLRIFLRHNTFNTSECFFTLHIRYFISYKCRNPILCLSLLCWRPIYFLPRLRTAY